MPRGVTEHIMFFLAELHNMIEQDVEVFKAFETRQLVGYPLLDLIADNAISRHSAYFDKVQQIGTGIRKALRYCCFRKIVLHTSSFLLLSRITIIL